MKKIVFLVLIGFATIQYANAQLVELIGKGVYNVTPSELIIDDPDSVKKVVVVATARFDNWAIPENVTFSDDDDSFNVGFNNADPILAPSYDEDGPYKFGYYTATFTDVDGNITLDNSGQEEYVRSFTAYVYRTVANSLVYCEVQGEYAFVFLNGSNNPLVYDFNIPASSSARDITVSLPFTDLESGDLRYANVAVTAGSQEVIREFDTNNEGDLLHIETLTLYDVPGDITDVKVEIYSPNQEVDGKNGDSFVTGPAVLTTTVEVEEDWGCTYTQGYWKTHSEFGPAPYDDNWANLANGAGTEFYLSGMSWYEVFWTPVKGNAYYNLAHQYMAAHLNMLMGASMPQEVADALTDAEDIFEANEPDYYAKIRGKSEASKQEIAWLTSLASILASYNEGDIGPGHCDDMEEWGMEKSAQIGTSGNDIAQINELTVYPNPVTGNATVSFTPFYDGKTTVDLYNSTGQTVKRLFSESVTKDIPVNFTFSAAEFSEGLYFLVVQNEQGTETAKIDLK